MAAGASRYDVCGGGAGTARWVVASRLSEGGDVRVLLLEAGSSQPSDLMAVPAAWPALMGSSADWGDQTVRPDATGRAMSWPRGRGNGPINAFIPNTGRLIGSLKDSSGKPIVIDGLWSLLVGDTSFVGPDSVLFTGGPDDETHGLVGRLTASN